MLRSVKFIYTLPKVPLTTLVTSFRRDFLEEKMIVNCGRRFMCRNVRVRYFEMRIESIIDLHVLACSANNSHFCDVSVASLP